MLELEQECIGDEEAREKETVGKREASPRNVTGKCSAGFADLNKLLRKYKTWTPNTKKFLLIERNVHGELSASKEIYGEKNKPSKHHGYIFENSETSSRSLRQLLQNVFLKKALLVYML